jgi:hypothetical protein
VIAFFGIISLVLVRALRRTRRAMLVAAGAGA